MSKKRPQEKQHCFSGLINDFSHVADKQQVDKSITGHSVQGSAFLWLETNTAALFSRGYAHQAFSLQNE